MKIYVDDLRQAPEGWVLARTITEAIRMLAELAVEEVSLDHDIVYVDERGQWLGKNHTENYTPVARYIAQMPKSVRPKIVKIHTSNAVGAEALKQILGGCVDEIIIDYSHRGEWTNFEGVRKDRG